MGSEYQLDVHQKDSLINLLSLDDENADLLFKNIEYQMEESFLSSDLSRSTRSDVSEKLVDIAETAKLLRIKLSGLDQTLRNNVESSVWRVIVETQTGGHLPQSFQTYGVIELIEELERSANSLHGYLDFNHSFGGKWEKVLSSLHTCWCVSMIHKDVTISVDSKYIRYLSIVLKQENSTMYKAVGRSKWWKDYKNHTKSKLRT